MKSPTEEIFCQNCGRKSSKFFPQNAENFRNNIKNVSKGQINICSLCNKHFHQRNYFLNIIIRDKHNKKLIVSGPGTGKTFTFNKVLEILSLDKKAVVFTLINNLVEDLKNELSSLPNKNIKATTFHGFCREMLHSKIILKDLKKDFEYFVNLPTLIQDDAKLLNLNYVIRDFNKAFSSILEKSDALKYYFERGTYYNASSHGDSVYRVYLYYRDNPASIPQYELIISDEFQDFNLLESSFIKLLATRSEVLFAGDDDQALYKFRFASKGFIRELYGDTSYRKYSLPFCSRCTPILVNTTNYFIKKIKNIGLLKGRIPRYFESYWPDKYRDNDAYPFIHVADCSSPKTTEMFIKEKILKIVELEKLKGDKKNIQFLIIGPEAGFQLTSLYNYLVDNLDKELFNILFKEKNEFLINDGYSLLQKDINSNLGWRTVLFFDPITNLKDIIQKSFSKKIPIIKLLPKQYVALHQSKMKEKKMEENDGVVPSENNEKIIIKLTNFYGSKGLSAFHTFIMGMNNGIMPRDASNIDEDEVCKFVVALTRAKKSCTIIYSNIFNKKVGYSSKEPSIFINFIPAKSIIKKCYKIRNGKLSISTS